MVGGAVFLYPGQGSQTPGMARDLFDRYEAVKELFQRAGEATGRDMAALLFEGSDEDLKATENSQPAITLASLAAREALAIEGIVSAGAAGHSLGEYSALVDAEVLTAEDALVAVAARGRYMGEAGAAAAEKKGDVGMAAVIGIGPEKVREVLAGRDDVWPANENGPNQVVIAGTRAAMDGVSEDLKENGARRVIPLKVSGPFHTPLLADAADRLAETLSSISFGSPTKTVWSNVTAAVVQTGDEARKLLVRQITSPVLWVDLTTAVAADGPGLLAEAGPGNVLTGLWNKSGLDGQCHPAGTAAAIDDLINISKE